MIRTNFAFYASKVVVELAQDIIYFPIWWYTKGFWQLILGTQRFLSDMLKSLAILIWLKNLFVPMFSQHDFAGRVISFFMRLVQIIFRSFLFLFLALLSLVPLVLWLIAPIYIIYQIIWQIF
ncbi:MAG: hypothetical protein UT42_C0040G0010 [Candidatus Falkowbacteria bacterium GW2011_GWA2_39_24]|uniref:Uncharacterized protein n=1 Tax=Candidatus Falkowbacteria bacterium GW2011_GWA2_39_24 TaxID=1618634 RepID=A0A0G0NC27_9BACT|nr:MAG: hypothetical protein UT42_C0040G0010 [Candidatus Falkowbacteria bacterium GW2011_GWA2_39_24]